MTFTQELVVVAKHARLMLYKLSRRRKKHIDRESHKKTSMTLLFARGQEEMDELIDAIRRYEEEPTASNLTAIRFECADVSNYMAFLSDRAAQEPLT